MVSSFSESASLVISPLAATMADDDSDKDKGPVERWKLYFTTYNVATCTAIYHMWNSWFDCVNKPLVPEKNFEKIISVVEVKSMKTAKFIVSENFPLYGI